MKVNNRGGKRPGAGRKSAIKELVDYKKLVSLFTKKYNINKLSKKIESGKYSVQDRFILDCLIAEKENRIALFKKIFPDGLIADITNQTDFTHINIDK